ncbi:MULTISPECIES: MDR family MFS transporter [Corynebacterium]|nr:MDR family MFS transporter [Corynebacterium sp. zg254]
MNNNTKIVFSCLMLGMLMSSLGQMIFSTALPTLVGELGGVEHMSWVITIFLVTMTIGMPIYGKLGDQVGRKPLYIIAIVLFLTGSAVGALAQNMTMMIIARGIQGAGAGGLMIGSQSIIADVIPARERGKYMGIMGSVFGLSSVLGPLLGGFFTDGPGWRWALWFNLPLGLLCLSMVIPFMKLPRHHRQARFDYLGAIFLAIATSCLILFITWGGRDYPWGSAMILTLIAVTVVATTIFVIVERRVENPLVPMGLFRVRNFTLSTIGGTIVGVVMFGTLAYMPTYIQMVHSMSPTAAGLMMIPMMAGMIITSTISGRRVSQTGNYKWYPVVGMVIVALAMVLFGQFTEQDSLLRLGTVLAIMGVGLGLVMQILVLIVQNAFPITMVGTATATNNFFRQIGGAIGTAVIGSVFTHRLQDLLAERMLAAIKTMGAQGAQLAQRSEGMLHSLTPDSVQQLPEPIFHVIVGSYNDALVPILLCMAPAALAGALVLSFNKHQTLKETIE